MTTLMSRRNIAIRCLKEHTFAKGDVLHHLIAKQVDDLCKAIHNQERVDKRGLRGLSADTFVPNVLSTVWSVLTGNDHVEVSDR